MNTLSTNIGVLLITASMFFTSGCRPLNDKKEKIFRLNKTQLLQQIAKENTVMGGAVGPAAIEPDQWVRFVALQEKTDDQEMLGLMDHTNNTVKCYAFMALLTSGNDALFPVLLKKLSDTGTVNTLFGCIGGRHPVNEFYVQQILSRKLISKEQRQILDSTIFFLGDSNLVSQFNILENLNPDPPYYPVAKKRVQRDPAYAILLSKYERAADRKIISDLLKSSNRSSQYWGLRAVSRYPHPDFFSHLSELAKDNYTILVKQDELYLYALYEALVRYRNKVSREILSEAIEKSDGIDSLKKSDLIYQALKRYPDSVYKNLLQYF